MGRLVMVKCRCGFIKDDYRYGFTAGYSDTQAHLTALVKSGRYGNVWRERLASDSELLVDAAWAIYQCTCCQRIYDEYSLDLYKSGQKYYAPSPEDVIYQYRHFCPKCQKRMERIELGGNKSDKPEKSVICPKCGDIATISFCGFMD